MYKIQPKYHVSGGGRGILHGGRCEAFSEGYSSTVR